MTYKIILWQKGIRRGLINLHGLVYLFENISEAHRHLPKNLLLTEEEDHGDDDDNKRMRR